MAAAPNPAEILKRNALAAEKFAERAGTLRPRAALERAAKDLERRLKQADGLRGPGADSFTSAQLRTTLLQVRAVLRPLQKAILGDVRTAASQAAETSADATLRYLRAAERHFSGIASRLPIDEASMFEAAVNGSDSSLLSRIAADPEHPGNAGVLARYGTATIGLFERELQQRYLARAPWEEVRDNLISTSPFLQGAPAYWAERIVRTESMAATNKASLESIRVADETLGDMVKILMCTVDNRTGADSIAVHGQIRRTTEPFESWNGSFQHPPDRPNDRASVVPHRISWPIPAGLQPKSDGEISAAWAREGRKGSPPARPLMSTIDRELFGRTAPPPIPRQDEPQ